MWDVKAKHRWFPLACLQCASLGAVNKIFVKGKDDNDIEWEAFCNSVYGTYHLHSLTYHQIHRDQEISNDIHRQEKYIYQTEQMGWKVGRSRGT